MKPTRRFSRIHLTVLTLCLLLAGSLVLVGCGSPNGGSSGSDQADHQHSHH